MTNGNKRQNGLKLLHINKGKGFLENKIHEIEKIVSDFHPHLLGISEANLFKQNDLENVQLQDICLFTIFVTRS